MAQYVVYDNTAEVNLEAILSVVNCLKVGKEVRNEILLKHHIDIENGQWFKKQDWLNAFKEISEDLGEFNLFLTGKAVIETAILPPMNSLEEALHSLNVGYHMNHKVNGELAFNPATGEMLEGIGCYEVVAFNNELRTAVVCHTSPYPWKLVLGVITEFVSRFSPLGSDSNVEVDDSEEAMSKRENDCYTYLISW